MTDNVAGALAYLKRDFSWKSTEEVDVYTYRKSVRACLQSKDKHSWWGTNSEIDEANILEMVNYAKAYICIVDCTGDKYEKPEVVDALKAAHKRGVKIYLALGSAIWEKSSDGLKEIRDMAYRYMATYPSIAHDSSQILIADDVYRSKHFGEVDENETYEWSAYTQTYADDSLIDSIAQEYFDLPPKAFSNAVKRVRGIEIPELKTFTTLIQEQTRAAYTLNYVNERAAMLSILGATPTSSSQIPIHIATQNVSVKQDKAHTNDN